MTLKCKIEPRTDRATIVEINDVKVAKYPFRLKVGTGAQRRYIALNISAPIDRWDADTERFLIKGSSGDERKDLVQKNELFIAIVNKCNTILQDFEREGCAVTPLQFIDRYNSNAGSNAKIADYFVERIETLRQTGHIGNANCYHRTLEMLRLFDKHFDKVLFNDVTYKYVDRFDTFLQKDRTSTYKYKNSTTERKRSGCSGNTRKYYHKALRAILNRAIADKTYDGRSYPYGKGGFEVGSLEEETAKRYLTADKLQAIRETPLDDIRLEVVRRVFICQYLCYGMSWADAGLLTLDNIEQSNNGKCIVYKRTKTKHAKKVKPIVIHIRQELQDHLDWFRDNCNLVDDYLFPIVSIEGYEGEQLYNHIRHRFIRNNKILQNDIAPLFGIEGIKLTSYVSRHTLAMTLQSQEVSREVIAQVMGHSDMATTNTYLDSFDTNIIKNATDNI